MNDPVPCNQALYEAAAVLLLPLEVCIPRYATTTVVLLSTTLNLSITFKPTCVETQLQSEFLALV